MKQGICPICKKNNMCASVLGTDPLKCWCMNIKVPKKLLDSIPEEDRMKSCVCKECVESFKKNNPEE